MAIKKIIQEVYYYEDSETGQLVVDEEEVLAEFKDKLAEIVLENMGI